MTTTPNLRQSAQSADKLLAEIKSGWGITDFRPLQAAALEAQLTGRDSLVIMPTGGGKSLCYQAPAAHVGGATIVVSPLIALMKDQVDQFHSRFGEGRAAFVNSTQPVWEHARLERELLAGRLALLYLSPERFCTPAFMALLFKPNVAAIVVDEAHCVSHWGPDFRPAYLELGKAIAAIRAQKPGISLHAYTATASPAVKRDIIHTLFQRSAISDQPSASPLAKGGLRGVDPLILAGSFDRPNLHLRTEEYETHEYCTYAAIDYVEEHLDQAGIIYCPTRRDTEQLCTGLNQGDLIRAAFYHAGMSDEDRKTVQDAFMSGVIDVVVATIAFGMGINKPDVRYVLHVGMPNHLDIYHQEIGRAGRDGEPAECVLFWSEEDYGFWTEVFFRDEDGTAELTNGEGEAQLAALDEMYLYCHTDECRRHALIEGHFGQPYPGPCHNCDNCAVAPPPPAGDQNRDSHGAPLPSRAREEAASSKAEGGRMKDEPIADCGLEIAD